DGQVTPTHYSDPLKAEVNMAQFDDPFAFTIQYEEAPHPSGKAAMRAFLKQRKLEAQRATPVHEGTPVGNRGSIPAPDILASFSGNNIITGTPLDNHLAVNQSEQVISTINTHMLVTNSTGFWLGSYKLDLFFQSIDISTRFFDPRVIYDPQADRFIMVLINGSVCDDSQIVIAFSKTNDPKGSWNLYALDGCLKDDNTFADYPMIAITNNDFFLTYNAVHSDSTWQAGFYGSQIHQINKQSGYNGEALQRKVWTDVTYNGRLLRNVVPLRNADENLSDDLYLMSDRNFDLTNDTVFLLHLTGEQDDPNAELNIEYRLLDQPYGVPPYALQTRDSLDTNDARILDGFVVNGQIQWVGNTMDFNTGRSGVFHGTLQVDDPFQTAKGHIIAHPTDYLGYPGIVWTGSNANENDAIIVMSHSSATRHPGGSAIYSDGLGEYSEFVTVIEGQRAVDMLTGGIERWGDYVGIQRLYHQPGSAWVSMSYGRPGNVNEAWIAKLARQEENVATHNPTSNIHLSSYPNPTDDYVQIDIDNPDGGEYHVVLTDMKGNILRTLYDGPANYPGKASLNFSTHALPAGQYVVHVTVNGKNKVSRQVIKQ
ncbi:MAG: T9SS type A sorting domain-containing protein, partial [Bacteroidota bacterium]|nr:T9SS type A sorting domain-containing protein [Bacteroidota bacterium]